MKYVVVCGGVVSGLGKGITISSIGVILKACGLRVSSIKIDPYLNVDAGTMSPFEHGEVFVLDDGGEADLDIGNYERFLEITLTRDHNITTGKVYDQVIKRERTGDYLGKTVQVVPHITDAIQDWMERVAHVPVDGTDEPPDVCLVEVGGTVGDIESMVFLEALRQFQFRVGPENFLLAHVSLVPVLGSVGEQKTKPTQHGIKELRSVGLTPDLIICRAQEKLEPGTKAKIGMFCHIKPDCVMSVHDVSNIYHVPIMLTAQNIHHKIFAKLGLAPPNAEPRLDRWVAMAEGIDRCTDDVTIGLVGKYTGLQDAYLSVIKGLKHASIATGRNLVIEWIDACGLEEATKSKDEAAYEKAWASLKAVDGILVPGGFGTRGVEGKIAAAQYARTSGTPFFGICLGFQCAVIEYARNVVGWKDAHSAEFDEHTDKPVIIFMPEINASQMGGTMRLGARKSLLAHTLQAPGADGTAEPAQTLASYLYAGKSAVSERHRHRYEVNPELTPDLEAAGLFFTGKDDQGKRMEIAELPRDVHPFYFAVQYHPEFKSHPHSPSPPFLGLITASIGRLADVPAHQASALTPPISPPRRKNRAAAGSSPAALDLED